MRFTRTATVLGAACLLVLGAAVGYAAIPSSDGSVKLCYAKAGGLAGAKGTARVVDAAEACKSTEASVKLASSSALEAQVAGLQATANRQAKDIESMQGDINALLVDEIALYRGAFSLSTDVVSSSAFRIVVNVTGLKAGSDLKVHYTYAQGVFSYVATTLDGDGDAAGVHVQFGCDSSNFYFTGTSPSGLPVRSAVIPKGPNCP